MAPTRYYDIESRWQAKLTDYGASFASAAREKLSLPAVEGQSTNLYDELDERLNLVLARVKLFYKERIDGHHFDHKSWVCVTEILATQLKDWEKDLGDRGLNAIGYCNMYEFFAIDKTIETENTANKEGNVKVVFEYQVGKKAKNSEGNLEGKYHHKLTWKFKVEKIRIPVYVSSRRSTHSDDESASGVQDSNETSKTEANQSDQAPPGSLGTQGGRGGEESLQTQGGGEVSFKSFDGMTGTSAI